MGRAPARSGVARLKALLTWEGWKPIEKSRSSENAKARMQKQQKDASRRSAPDAQERIPTAPPAQRLDRPAFFFRPLLERFLDWSELNESCFGQSNLDHLDFSLGSRFVRVKIHLWLDCWQNHLVS
jgi:hypothetical protein